MPEEKRTTVFFSCFYEPFMSGAERFVKEVAERLEGSRFFVIITARLRPDLPDEEDFGGYKVVRVGRGDKWDKIRYIWLAPRAAKKYNPQIIHAVMESYAGLALWRAKKVLPGVKRILTLQSGDLDAKKILKMWPLSWMWKKIHTSPDYITAISNFLAARAERLGAKNVEVVPNGADLNLTGQIAASSSNKEKNGHRIICMARLSWEKGHKNLIAAMPKILEKYPDAELFFVGEGPLRENIKYQISNLKLEDKIKLLGNLPHETALEELSKSDVSICPSLAEGLGITFIESQTAGVPVIGTRVGGIPDVIEDGRTGVLIEPGNSEEIAGAIIKIFEMSGNEKVQMIKNARENALRKFNWDNIANSIDCIYQKEKSLSILICTGIYPPDIGGPATYTKLIQEELWKRGHEARILTYSSSVIPAKAGIQAVDRKYPLPLRYFLYFWKVLKLGKNVDIIYVQDPVSVGLPTALANLILRKKMILKIVGDYSWEMAQQVQGSRFEVQSLDDFYPFKKENYPLKINLLRKIQNWVAKRADKVITPSFYLKNILTEGWGIAEEKIKVIYNSFGIAAGVIPAKAGIPQNIFKILSVGRLVPWKGFDALIEIVKDLPGVELEIIGDGPQKENYQFSITNFQLQDRVKLLGKLEHDEVVQKMCSSDLFILNSNYEGLSHVILEAMACGLPVAVSRAGGNRELISYAPFFGRETEANENNGYLFDYNNKEQIKEKINYIISHPEEAKERAERAREYVTGLSKEKMIDELESALLFRTLPMLRNRTQKVRDFIAFPFRALALIETDRWGMSSLVSERFDYVARYVKGYCLDVGCGKNNRFIREYLAGHGRGIDVYPYEGLFSEHIVADITHFPFADGAFTTVTFIANINHIPEPQRDIELAEAYRCLQPGGNIVVTMGNPVAELFIHGLLHFYDSLFGTSYDLDGKRGMQEGEAYYLSASEITSRLSRAGFINISGKYFTTQWGLNRLFIAEKPFKDIAAKK